MSDNHQKYWTLGAICDQWIAENDLTEHWFKKALLWAQWGLRELKLDTYQDTEACLLDVTDRRTVVLPPNYVDFVKMGAVHGQFCIALAQNDAMHKLPRTENQTMVRGLLSQNMPNGLNVNNYAGGYYFNYYGSNTLGLDGGLPDARSFQVVKRENCYEVLLNVDFVCDKLYVEYITDGFKPCGETVVNPMFADYVLKYIEARYEAKNNPNRTSGSIDRANQAVWYAEVKVRGRVNSISMADFLAISRSQTRLTPKI